MSSLAKSWPQELTRWKKPSAENQWQTGIANAGNDSDLAELQHQFEQGDPFQNCVRGLIEPALLKTHFPEPDTVALCFVLNQQNIDGIVKVAAAIHAKPLTTQAPLYWLSE